MDWLDLLAVQGTLKSLLQDHSSKASILQHSAFFSPTLTSIHDYWKNHNLDSMDLCTVIFHCSLIRIFPTTNIFNTFACWNIFLMKNFFRIFCPFKKLHYLLKFYMAQMVKNLPANAGDTRDMDSIPGSRRSPGKGNCNPLQYFCLENSMDREALWATVHEVAKESDTT